MGYQDAESPGRRLLELQQGGDALRPTRRGEREAVPALQDSGKRRGSFISAPKRRLEATKEQHARQPVLVRYEPTAHELRVILPESLAPDLFGEGDYTLEVLRGKLSRIKLTQRDPDRWAPRLPGSPRKMRRDPYRKAHRCDRGGLASGEGGRPILRGGWELFRGSAPRPRVPVW